MTDIDTAAIRNAWGSYDHYVPTPWEKVADLCDALDAARKQRDSAFPSTAAYHAMKDRAEAAEARHEIDVRYIAKIEARMEAAEARIAEMEQDYRAERDRQETAANHTQRQRDHFRD